MAARFISDSSVGRAKGPDSSTIGTPFHSVGKFTTRIHYITFFVNHFRSSVTHLKSDDYEGN